MDGGFLNDLGTLCHFIIKSTEIFSLPSSFFFYNFIYFLAALGLCCCAQAFCSCGEQWLLFLVVPGCLIVVAPLVTVPGLQAHGLSNCGLLPLKHRLSSCAIQDWVLLGMWGLPGPGIKPVTPALTGGFFSTEPPGKP